MERVIGGNFAAVADLHDQHDQFLISNLIDNAIVARADAVETLLSRQLFHTVRPGVRRQSFHGRCDTHLRLARKLCQLAVNSGGKL
jgi:hypothetical protein